MGNTAAYTSSVSGLGAGATRLSGVAATGTAGPPSSSSSSVRSWGAKAVDRGEFMVWVAVLVSAATLALLWWSESFL